MDRRKFIKVTNTGALATVALSGFSKILNAQDETPDDSPKPYCYVYFITYEDKTGYYEFEVCLFHEGIENYASASQDLKRLGIWTKYYIRKSGEEGYETRESEALYHITDCELINAEERLYQLFCEYQYNVKGDYDMPDDFYKNLYIRVNLSADSLTMYDKDGQVYKVLESWDDWLDYYYYYYYDCFLSSACLNSMRLPDDCYELETLRNFRDGYMQESERGRELIEQYKVLGPSIVFRINEHPRSRAMWDYLYSSLIGASIAYIEEGRNEEAMEYYAEYVRGLDAMLSISDDNLNEW